MSEAAAVNARQLALNCLLACDPDEKCALTLSAGAQIAAARTLERPDEPEVLPLAVPGRPDRPLLVPPRELVQRKLNNVAGRAALVHAVAHIEFNAINLAWDAVYRFPAMPAEFVLDWASVAVDEARHFQLLQQRLNALGHAYGDFPAHNGLWSMALATQGDVLERMALVPRVLEARGLDVTPGMIERLRSAGDRETVACLEVILAEEVRHVAIGTRWFRHLCAVRQLEPYATFVALVQRHGMVAVRGPLNEHARLAAGFDTDELRALQSLAAA